MTFTLCRPQITPRRGQWSDAGETGVGRRGPKAPVKWPVVGMGRRRRAGAWETWGVGKREAHSPGMVSARPTDTSVYVNLLVTVPMSTRPSEPEWGPQAPWCPLHWLGWNPR